MAESTPINPLPQTGLEAEAVKRRLQRLSMRLTDLSRLASNLVAWVNSEVAGAAAELPEAALVESGVLDVVSQVRTTLALVEQMATATPTVDQAIALAGILRTIAQTVNRVSFAGGVVLEKHLDIVGHILIPGTQDLLHRHTAGEEHIVKLSMGAAILTFEANWLVRMVARSEIEGAVNAASIRMRRMRARRALQYRTATVNVHRHDLDALRTLELLPFEGDPSQDDIDAALDAFVSACFAQVGSLGDDRLPDGQATVAGGWRLGVILQRIADIIKIYAPR